MRTIEVAGAEFAYLRRGSGAPVVLLHGFPLNHQLWRHAVEALQDHFDVIAVDLPGFGQSEAPHSELWSMEMFADLTAAFLDRLHLALPVHLIGLSMGGYIAFEFQRKFSRRLASLTLCHTRPHADEEAVKRARQQMATRVLKEGQRVASEAMLPKLFAMSSYEKKPEVIEEVRGMIEATSPRSIAAGQRAMADRRDATSWLPMIDCPVLVLAGEDDRITPAADMRGWSRMISQSTFAEISAAGHSSPLENPAEFISVVRAFLLPLATKAN